MWQTPKTRQNADALDGAILAWRRQAGFAERPRLSDAARDHILREACETDPTPATFAELFAPRGRFLVLAGAVPLALALALAAWIGEPRVDRVAAVPGAAVKPVHATKNGEDVIFLIANGSRPHAVYKSSQPDRFDSPPALTENGTFRDALNSGPDLVFYRIE